MKTNTETEKNWEDSDRIIPTIKEFKDFIWQLDMASAELSSFVDSNHSVSELDRVDESNSLLFNALYESGKEIDMTMPERLEEILKYLAHHEQTNQE